MLCDYASDFLGPKGLVNDDGTSARGEDLVSRVESYFYEDEDFCSLFQNFCAEHIASIDLHSEENKLVYTVTWAVNVLLLHLSQHEID